MQPRPSWQTTKVYMNWENQTSDTNKQGKTIRIDQWERRSTSPRIFIVSTLPFLTRSHGNANNILNFTVKLSQGSNSLYTNSPVGYLSSSTPQLEVPSSSTNPTSSPPPPFSYSTSNLSSLSVSNALLRNPRELQLLWRKEWCFFKWGVAIEKWFEGRDLIVQMVLCVWIEVKPEVGKSWAMLGNEENQSWIANGLRKG